MEKIQELTIDSREVSQMVDKRHADLIRDIETYIDYFSQNAKLRSDDFFLKYQYQSGTGKNYKCYLVTKKGCEFLAHKLTGKKGAIFTATYINKFHDMEKEIQNKALIEEPTQLTIEPVTELQRKTYKGIPVMVINDLAQILGLSKYTAYWRVRQSNIPYIVLQGKNLFDFKAENSGFAVQTKSLAIMFYEDVLEFCRVLNLDTTMVIKYFEGSIVVKRDSRNVPSENDYKKAEFMLKASETLQDKKMANFVAMEALKLIAGESIVEDYDIVVILNEVIHMTKGKSLNQIKAMKKDAEEMMKKENASSEVKEFMMSVFDRAILRKMF